MAEDVFSLTYHRKCPQPELQGIQTNTEYVSNSWGLYAPCQFPYLLLLAALRAVAIEMDIHTKKTTIDCTNS